jgi:hypothetical protein
MPRTLEEVRKVGLEALKDRLGRADTIRFLQQFETGSGDYSTERWEWVDRVDLTALERAANADCARDSLPEAS